MMFSISEKFKSVPSSIEMVPAQEVFPSTFVVVDVMLSVDISASNPRFSVSPSSVSGSPSLSVSPPDPPTMVMVLFVASPKSWYVDVSSPVPPSALSPSEKVIVSSPAPP